MKHTCRIATSLVLFLRALVQGFAAEPLALPTKHTTRDIEGWSVRVDDRFLAGESAAIGERALKLLTARLVSIEIVVPEPALAKLRAVAIELDLDYGDLKQMQYHPDAGWLKEHGYSEALAKCVHIPRADDFLSPFENHGQPIVSTSPNLIADRRFGLLRGHDPVVRAIRVQPVLHRGDHGTAERYHSRPQLVGLPFREQRRPAVGHHHRRPRQHRDLGFEFNQPMATDRRLRALLSEPLVQHPHGHSASRDDLVPGGVRRIQEHYPCILRGRTIVGLPETLTDEHPTRSGQDLGGIVEIRAERGEHHGLRGEGQLPNSAPVVLHDVYRVAVG